MFRPNALTPTEPRQRIRAAWRPHETSRVRSGSADRRRNERRAMSGDGNTLAIAAFGGDGGSSGAGGNQADNSVRASGAVYVY